MLAHVTCPVFLEEMTHTSAGFSMATMARAASRSFSQVFLRLTMYTPDSGEDRHRLKFQMQYIHAPGCLMVGELALKKKNVGGTFGL